ncbi:MAG: LEA type 2 family protein [Cellvibrionaceae bacterium]
MHMFYNRLTKMISLYSFLLLLLLSLISNISQANNLFTMTAPEVEVSQVEFLRWVEKDLFLNVSFSVTNQNDSDVNIKAIRYEMLVMGRSITKDYHEQKIFLGANTISEIVLPITIDMMRLFSVMPEALLANKVEYVLTGAVVVEGLVLHLPFEQKGSLPLYNQPQ